MTTKRYLSEKKTASQNIAISPALKDWVERYVKAMHKEHPEDESYKSISAFYCTVMENILKAFEKGKTLEDFDRMLDREIDELYNQFTMKTIVHYYEAGVELNRYNTMSFKKTMRYQYTWLGLFKNLVDPLDPSSLQMFFDRMRNFYMENGQTALFHLDLFTIENSHHFTGVLELGGKTRNIHYENCKYLTYFLSVIGVEITRFLYSNKDYYARFDLKTTELYFSKGLARKEKLALMEKNLSHITNYCFIVNDQTHYLWLKMASDEDIYVNFKNKDVMKKWIQLIEQDVREFCSKENWPLSYLRYFEKLHWIKIQNPNNLTFHISPTLEHSPESKDFMLSYLSKKGALNREQNLYSLNPEKEKS